MKLIKSKRSKWIISILFLFLLIISGYLIYQNQVKHRFQIVDPGKVYSSGVLPPKKIKDFVEEFHIKTIIDLREGYVQDALNPETVSEIREEHLAIEKIPGVKHINIPSVQIPSEENLYEFFKVMDNPDNYPVWIHCYHGIGRARIYGAIYKIEYMGLSPEEARKETTWPLMFSNFDSGTEKGDYLIHYQKHKKTVTSSELNTKDSTLQAGSSD